MSLSAVIITKNEEKNIRRCLGSVAFCDERIVVDSGSADATAAIAESLGAKVIRRDFEGFAAQKNFAVSCASGEWILSVDADETVSSALAEEIRMRVSADAPARAYRVHRRTNFFGRDFRFSGLQKDAPVRLFRKDAAVFVNPVHEIVEVRGKTGDLRQRLEHRSFQTIGEYWQKLQLYTSIEAAQGARERSLRGRDLWLKPPARFWLLYVWGRGFLDGFEGFLYAVLSSYYEFILWIKKWEAGAMTKEKQ